jgi:hypothetical protein
MKHIEIYEAFSQSLNTGIVPITQVLANPKMIDFSVLPDKKTVIISQSDGRGGVVPGSSYKYSAQGRKGSGILSVKIGLEINSIVKKPDGSMEVKVIPTSSLARKSSQSKIGPDGWITAPVGVDKVDSLIKDLVKSRGKSGTLETENLSVDFSLIGPQ